MKKFKRIIALVTVAVFVLSFAAPAAFAKTTDDAVGRLNALGIVVGYGDGSFKPEQNITRAEYAAIVVQALGLGEAAKYVKGNTKFKDVKADHWASGVINVAVSQGILAGYPDGTFKPEKNVSYNEAITMVVRMLGYADTMDNPVYPTSFVAKAAELKILDDMSVTDYAAPATRGNVFMLADNALDTEIWQLTGTDNDGKKHYGTIPGDTLLKVKQKVTELADNYITDAGIGISGVSNDYVKFNGTEYKWSLGKSAMDFVGLKGKAYIQDKGTDKKFVAFKPVGSIITGKVDKVNGSTKIKLYGQDEKELVSDWVYVIRGQKNAADTNWFNNTNLQGHWVTLALDDNGKVVSIIMKDPDGASMVKSVNTSDKKIELKNAATIDLKNVDAKNQEIYKNGKPATLADIKAGDTLIYYSKDTSHYSIYVTDTEVKGKLESAAACGDGKSFKLVIDGKTYYSRPQGIYTSTDGLDSISQKIADSSGLTDLGADFVTKNVTVKLDALGLVEYLYTGTASDTQDATGFDAFVNEIYTDTSSGNQNAKIVVTKLDGTKVTYDIDNDDYQYFPDGDRDGNSGINKYAKISTSEAVYSLTFAKISLNSAGKVDTLTNISSAPNAATNAVNKDQNYVVTTAGNKFADSNTKIVRVKKWGNNDTDKNFAYEVEISSWDSGKGFLYDNWSSTGFTAYYKDSKLKYIYIESTTSISSDYLEAYVDATGVVVGSGKFGITILQPGDNQSKQTYEVTDSNYNEVSEQAALKTSGRGEVIIFKFNNDKTKIEKIVVPTGTDKISLTVDSYDTLRSVYDIKPISGSNVQATTDVKVFVLDGNGIKAGSMSDVSNGKTIYLYNTKDKDGKVTNPPGDSIYDVIVVDAR